MTNKNKTFLVTGAAGFIGFHLCKELLKEGKNVLYAIDQDYGWDHSVRLKFFNQETATITTTKKIIDITESNNLLSSSSVLSIPALRSLIRDSAISNPTTLNFFEKATAKGSPT